MISNLVCILCLSFNQATSPVQKVELVRDDKVSVELHLKRTTDLSQLQWYWLEINNLTDKTFRIAFRFELSGPTAPNQPSLGLSTNLNDLFGDAWATSRDRSLERLKPGKSTYGLERFSRETHLARMPAFPGEPLILPLSARVDFTYWINEKRVDLHSPKSIAFGVKWTAPDQAGTERLKKELSGYFHQSEPMNIRVRQRYSYLLSLPELREDAYAVDRILERLQQSENPPDTLVRHLVVHHRTDPKVIEFYRKKLVAGSRDAYFALVITPDNSPSQLMAGIWDPSYCRLLAENFGNGKDKTDEYMNKVHDQMIYGLLDRHRKEWRDDQEVTSKLFEAIRKKYPALDRQTWEREGDELAYGLIWLGRTSDPAALPYLERGLEQKTKLEPLRAFPGIANPYSQRPNSIEECAALGLHIWAGEREHKNDMFTRLMEHDEAIKKATELLTAARKSLETRK
ncbi:MAG: hypothetical protein U0796_17985 [Gemmatales bacterium]